MTKFHQLVVEVVECFAVFFVPFEFHPVGFLPDRPVLVVVKGSQTGKVVSRSVKLYFGSGKQLGVFSFQIRFTVQHVHDFGIENLQTHFDLVQIGLAKFPSEFRLETRGIDGLGPSVVDFRHIRTDRIVIFLLRLGLFIADVSIEIQIGDGGIGRVFSGRFVHFLDDDNLIFDRLGFIETPQAFFEQFFPLID